MRQPPWPCFLPVPIQHVAEASGCCLAVNVLPIQTSVWGSGSAGAFCAVMALLTGNFTLWQVRRCTSCRVTAHVVPLPQPLHATAGKPCKASGVTQQSAQHSLQQWHLPDHLQQQGPAVHAVVYNIAPFQLANSDAVVPTINMTLQRVGPVGEPHSTCLMYPEHNMLTPVLPCADWVCSKFHQQVV